MKMKSDRELLELAAKAAGYDVSSDGEGGLTIPLRRGVCRDWDPLADDGDAIRLAVKLGIEIHPDLECMETITAFVAGRCGYNTREEWSDHHGDQMSATRMAIVISAAKIGESMQ